MFRLLWQLFGQEIVYEDNTDIESLRQKRERLLAGVDNNNSRFILEPTIENIEQQREHFPQWID